MSANFCLETVDNIGRYSKKRQGQNAKWFLKLIPICVASILRFIIKNLLTSTDYGHHKKIASFLSNAKPSFYMPAAFSILSVPGQVSTVVSKPLHFFSLSPVG